MRLFRSFKYLVLLVFVFRTTGFFAQEALSSAEYEARSYQYYSEGNWKGVINTVNEALENDVDYFYLRMRLGIAYFEEKNYALAEKQFRMALSFSSNDELAQEYLYYCYVYMGRTEDARWLSKRFSKELSKKTGAKDQSALNFMIVEGGTKITDSAYYYDKKSQKSTNYYDPATYLHVGLSHSIVNRFSLFHALTYFGQSNFVGTLKQMQYYVKAAVPFKSGWLISPAFHYIHINFTSTISNTVPSGPPPPPRPSIQTTVVTNNYMVAALAIQKTLGKFVFSLGNTYSNMLGQTQYIHSGFASYSVFGNSKLVVGATAYLHTTNSYSTTNMAYAPFIYVQPVTKLSFKLSYFLNKNDNIIEENAYLVNNSADLTQKRWSILASYTISKHLALYALYQLENKQENIQLFNYRYNIVVGGLKITP